jgi:hypothetical protein
MSVVSGRRREDEGGVSFFGFTSTVLLSRRVKKTKKECQTAEDDDKRMSHGFTESEARMRSGVFTRMYRISDMMIGDR